MRLTSKLSARGIRRHKRPKDAPQVIPASASMPPPKNDGQPKEVAQTPERNRERLVIMPPADKKLAAAGVLALAVAAFISFGLYQLIPKPLPLACTEANDGALAAEAGNLLRPTDPAKMQQLKAVIEKIQNINGFAEDFNCVYPAVNYFIYVNDKDKAKEQFEYLKKAEAANQTLADAYIYRATIEELQVQIDFLVKQAGNPSGNSILLFEAPQ